MEDLPPAAGTAFLRDLKAAHEAVRAGTTQDVRQQRMYQQWTDLCSTLLVNPDIQDPSIPHIELLQVYGHRFQHTQHSKRQVERLGKELVSQAGGGRLQPPTYWMTYPTPEIPPTPDLTLAWTSALPTNSNIMGSKITQSSRENPPPGHHPVHRGLRSLHLRPKDTSHLQPSPTGLLFMPQVL